LPDRCVAPEKRVQSTPNIDFRLPVYYQIGSSIDGRYFYDVIDQSTGQILATHMLVETSQFEEGAIYFPSVDNSIVLVGRETQKVVWIDNSNFIVAFSSDNQTYVYQYD